MKRFLPPPFFLIAAMCFFLPFLSVQCANDEASAGADVRNGEVTGAHLVAGSADDVLGRGLDLSSTQTFAGAVITAAAAGFFLSMLGGRVGATAGLTLGLSGVVALYAMAQVFVESLERVESVVVSSEWGFVGSASAFATAGVAGTARLSPVSNPTAGRVGTAASILLMLLGAAYIYLGLPSSGEGAIAVVFVLGGVLYVLTGIQLLRGKRSWRIVGIVLATIGAIFWVVAGGGGLIPFLIPGAFFLLNCAIVACLTLGVPKIRTESSSPRDAGLSPEAGVDLLVEREGRR